MRGKIKYGHRSRLLNQTLNCVFLLDILNCGCVTFYLLLESPLSVHSRNCSFWHFCLVGCHSVNIKIMVKPSYFNNYTKNLEPLCYSVISNSRSVIKLKFNKVSGSVVLLLLRFLESQLPVMKNTNGRVSRVTALWAVSKLNFRLFWFVDVV